MRRQSRAMQRNSCRANFLSLRFTCTLIDTSAAYFPSWHRDIHFENLPWDRNYLLWL